MALALSLLLLNLVVRAKLTQLAFQNCSYRWFAHTDLTPDCLTSFAYPCKPFGRFSVDARVTEDRLVFGGEFVEKKQ